MEFNAYFLKAACAIGAAILAAWGGGLYCEADTQATFNCTADVTQGLWVTLNEDSGQLAAGDYPVHITLTSLVDGTVLFESAEEKNMFLEKE